MDWNITDYKHPTEPGEYIVKLLSGTILSDTWTGDKFRTYSIDNVEYWIKEPTTPERIEPIKHNGHTISTLRVLFQTNNPFKANQILMDLLSTNPDIKDWWYIPTDTEAADIRLIIATCHSKDNHQSTNQRIGVNRDNSSSN